MAVTLGAGRTALDRLRREWLLLTAAGVLLVAAGFWLLRAHWGVSEAGRWALLAAAVLAYEAWTLRRGLADNHRPGEKSLLSGLGAANRLTLLRGAMLALMAGFLFAPWPGGWLAWAPAALYGAIVLIDGLDGAVARLTGQPTRLGEMLDLELDALGMLVAPLLGVWYRQLPPWFLLVSAARYLFVLGLWWRRRRGLPVYELPPSHRRRSLAGLMMGFTGVVLWPVFSPPQTWVAATAVMLPFLVGFARDWLAVSGRLRGAAPAGLDRWLPVALRSALAAAFVISCSNWDESGPALWGDSWPVLLVFAALAAFGAAGRLASLALIVTIGWLRAGEGLAAAEAVLLASGALLMVLGTGALSLWQPEEAVLSRRFAESEPAAAGEDG